LRTTQPYFKYPGPNPSTLVMLPCLSLRVRLCSYLLTFGIR